MTNINVRRKVLIPLSLTFVVLILAFVWASNGIRRTDENRILQHRFLMTQHVLNVLLEENAVILASTAEFIANQQSFRQVMTHHDMKTLQSGSKPLLDRLSNQLDITHYYYYDTQGNMLLRVYNPEDTSKLRVPRKNLQLAMETGKVAVGLELGSHGSFAQRLVTPWYEGGKLIGYIELGTDLQKIFLKVKHITGSDLIIAIDKKHVNFQKWEDAAGKRQTNYSWDFLANKLISNSTIEITQKLANSVFSTSTYGTIGEKLPLGQQFFRGAKLPQLDTQGLQVGDILVLIDVTDKKMTFYSFLFWVVGFSLMLSGSLFVFAYRILGRMGLKLTAGEALLREESANLEVANARLQEEIDIRTQAETQLQNLNQTLEQRVSERTSELEQNNALLEQSRLTLEKTCCELKEKQAAILHQDKMACIGQLAAGIAHDINNPVGFISHNLTLFERYFQRLVQFFSLQEERSKSCSTPEIKAGWEKDWRDFKVEEVLEEVPIMLDECHSGTKRITQIVQGLRSFIRSEIPRHEMTDLHHCLDSTLMLLQHELRNKISVVKEYQPIPHCYCYAQQMNQLFMNLLINACQAITGTGEILIRTWTENQHIFIAISDTGCGIPPEAIGKIYEPFFTTKPLGVGTGLGLSIVYEVVERHHGTLAVESEVGRGTTFTVTFPIDSRREPRDTPAAVTADAISGEPHE